MPSAITHPFVSGKSDTTDASTVRASNWNAGHSINLTDGSIPYVGSSDLLQSNSNLFWDSSGDAIHIGPRTGITTPYSSGAYSAAKHTVVGINPSTTSLFAVILDTNLATAQVSFQASSQDSHSSGAGTKAILIGVQGVLDHTGTGDTTTMSGVTGAAAHTGSGAVSSLLGMTALADWGDQNASSNPGNTTDVFGLKTLHSAYGASGSVTNMGGIYVTSGDRSGSPTVSNNYGIKIDDQAVSGANNWGLFTGTGVVQFGDILKLVASSTSRATLNIPSGTAPSSPNSGDMWYDGTNLKFRDGGTTRTITWT